ncbi:hypothetical protein LCGC14_2354220 [marine sediment metagenome]|uniref:Uncharacterized protein n=1 Tax=marine sediment metagenome TaxID=412755 RepID=A0A0F9EL04_9ZZZZ
MADPPEVAIVGHGTKYGTPLQQPPRPVRRHTGHGLLRTLRVRYRAVRRHMFRTRHEVEWYTVAAAYTISGRLHAHPLIARHIRELHGMDPDVVPESDGYQAPSGWVGGNRSQRRAEASQRRRTARSGRLANVRGGVLLGAGVPVFESSLCVETRWRFVDRCAVRKPGARQRAQSTGDIE